MARKASKSAVWKLCSEYNRRKDTDSDGFGVCCSCGKPLHWQEGDAGHFIPRTDGKALFWDPENLHLQCPGCNRFRKEKGKIGYTLFMIRKYGEESVERMREKARTIYRERQSDLEYWRDYYLEALKGLDRS